MKRFFTLFVVLIVFNSWFNARTVQAQAEPDPTLAAAVRRYLELRPTDPINWEALVEFSDTSGSIKSLKGLELATNLEWLELHKSPIDDLTPLANLKKLREITIWDNKINDLTPLAGLTQLEFLQFLPIYNLQARNQISDLTPLAGLIHLEFLTIWDNEIRDLTPLTGLTKLYHLGLANNQISDIAPLAGLTKLGGLVLGGNQISDITPLAGLTKLRVLEIQSNQISDITPLAGLTELESVLLGGNGISDITPLTRLTKLQVLSLHSNQISDIKPLAGLTVLEGLDMGNNQINDIKSLGGLTLLRGLALGTNRIKDLSSLAGLRNLQALFLARNQISNITPLTGLTKLEVLDIGENQIADADRLKTLPKLTQLRLGGNPSDYYNFVVILASTDIFHFGIPGGVRSATAPKPETPPQETLPQETPPQETPRQSSVSTSVNGAELPPMYWLDNKSNTLYRLTDGEVEPLLPNVQNATNLAIDVTKDKLYWTEQTSNKTGNIRCASLDGTHPQLVKHLTSVPHGIALDAADGKIYLTNSWGKVQRLNVDGSNFESNLIIGLEDLKDIAVDVAGGKLYWTEQTSETTGKIRRADLDGSNVQLVKDLTSVPHGLALDTTNRKIYFTNAWGKVQRLNFDGSNFQPNLITGLKDPKGIAVDLIEGRVYWTEKGSIRRASFNGENIEEVVTNLGSPVTLVLGTPPSSHVPGPQETMTAPSTDINEDGKVNKSDLLLVVTALGETSPTNPRVDVDGDGEIAIADLLLVIENLDDPVVGAAPAITTLPISVDVQALEAHLNVLRVLSDGSHKYQYAIGILGGLLASIRPIETQLLANYPNPFNPETWIPYQLSKAADVRLNIYSATGRLIRTFALGHQPAGIYQNRSRAAYWDGKNELGEKVASGVYFYTLSAGDFTATRKMLIRK